MNKTNPSTNHIPRASRRYRQKKIGNLFFLAGAVFVAVALAIILFSRSNALGSAGVRVGAPLDNFSLVDIHGNKVRLSDYTGRPVLINAWASWCPPCRAEMPSLNQYYQTYKDSGFVILAINDGESQSIASDFAGQIGVSFPVLLDPGTQELDRLGIHDLPTSILVGRDGLVKTIHIGLFTTVSLQQELTPFVVKQN
ncbi:MAG: TlpA family protein disulfide reductase [Chloroflexi bacterium]|nr:TlpA family protein disulfide reductase [Chloroflexota bacterium]